VRQDGLEHVPHVEIVGIALVVENVAPCDRGLIQVPDQNALIDGEFFETVGV
jgi:hypothetical protein